LQLIRSFPDLTGDIPVKPICVLNFFIMNLKIFFQLVSRAFILGPAIGLVSMMSAFTFRAPGKPDKAGGGFLWEISGKGLPHPSYLYGTIHAICPQDLVMNETIKIKLSSTQQLSLEIDMDDPNTNAVMMRETGMKDGSNLRSLLTEAEYSRLQAYFTQKLNLDLQQMETWKPIMLIGMLAGKIEECQPLSYEDIFMKMAQEQSKEVIGIETMETLMATLDQISYKNQAQMLVESMDNMEEDRQQFQQLIALYKQQDLEGFQKVIKVSAEMEKFRELVLVERNKRWIPVMEQQAKEKPTFFAVGAGHLGGSEGVIQLLRQAGYKVEPVSQDGKSR
jgi:uncharacterized protein